MNAPQPRLRARRVLGWPRRHPYRSVLLLGLLSGVGAMNLVAYRQARSMTRFQPPTGATRRGPSGVGLASLLWNGFLIEKSTNRATPFAAGLGFETLQLAAEDGTQLEAWWVPHPKPRATMVLLHGYANCKGNQLLLAHQLHRQGFDLLLLDFRGHGGSSGLQTSVGYHESLDVAAAFAAARARSASRPVIGYGISMGAAALLRAVHMGQTQPDALVLEAPFDRFVTTIANRFEALSVPSFPTANLLAFYGGLLTGSDASHHDPVSYAASVRQPVFLLHGERDRRVTVPQASDVFEALGSEDKGMHVFPRLRHEAYVRADALAWWTALEAFCDRVAPPAH